MAGAPVFTEERSENSRTDSQARPLITEAATVMTQTESS